MKSLTQKYILILGSSPNKLDVQIKAVFKGLNNEIITNSAFWNGDNQWVIRFCPDSTEVPAIPLLIKTPNNFRLKEKINKLIL